MNMYKYMDNYLFYSSNEIQKLIYKINNEDKIKIFGETFVGNNRNKCIISYKAKIFPLQTYFFIMDISKEDKINRKFEILLLEMDDISDKSSMFYCCESLIEFSNSLCAFSSNAVYILIPPVVNIDSGIPGILFNSLNTASL